MTDVNAFIAEDWKLTSDLTLNRRRPVGVLRVPVRDKRPAGRVRLPGRARDRQRAGRLRLRVELRSGLGSGRRRAPAETADSKNIIPGDYNNVMPRVGFAWTPSDRKNFVLRGGYGMFYERTTGGFANSLRQAPPFFRELQLNNLGDWNVVPSDFPALPIPSLSVAFDDGEPILVGIERSRQRVRGARDADGLARPRRRRTMQQWSINTQWEFRTELAARGRLHRQQGRQPAAVHQPEPGARHRRHRRLPAACRACRAEGSPATTTIIDNDDFVNLKTPPPGCDLLDDPGECIIAPELRGPLLGLDEDEGANMLVSNGKSWYHGLQTSLQKRFDAGLHVQRELHVLAVDRLLLRRGPVPDRPTTRHGPRTEQGPVRLPPQAPADPELGLGPALPGQRCSSRDGRSRGSARSSRAGRSRSSTGISARCSWRRPIRARISRRARRTTIRRRADRPRRGSTTI